MHQTCSGPRAWPAYRPFRVRVVDVTERSPHFVRVTFTGPELDVFGEHGLDQRITLVFPLDAATFDELGVDEGAAQPVGEWYRRWRHLPEGRRAPFRTYTVRRIDAARRLLDVDLVVHADGSGGVATAWLRDVAIGDEAIVIGPDARAHDSVSGIEWQPGDATDLLLVGDETAAPAIAAILERLETPRSVTAIVEVPCEGDVVALQGPPGADIRCLPRDGGAPGSRIIPELRGWVADHGHLVAASRPGNPQELDEVDVDHGVLWEAPDAAPEIGLFAWLAGEAGVIRTLRRILVSEVGVARSRVTFMGYWRLGRPAGMG
ncbi:siderophore-interacting protein [uncultured Tessaracoccus sp.]|uniref:siderophore-interacting protein n=1 Tax=uncultured Tessaracoccus sp. TaxID=905023 RepID=UPI0025F20F9D|nr:siderophore-interacting protein [uncultured Tessaracoccus sp.]